ncbi:MAG TPA: hypothetical protein VFO89_16330 [Thermoanaerobaculia bacterium]|nr:hypothetical protein [Thermoanaerobaculia bacterium]
MARRIPSRTGALCLWLLLTAFAKNAVAASPIEPISADNTARNVPIWLPLDSSLAADGGIDEAKFLSDELRRGLTTATKISDQTETCASIHVFDDFGVPALPRNFRGLATEATEMILGTVHRVVPGFYGGLPATAIEVIDDEAPERRLIVIYPVARFEAAELRFCREDHRYPAVPAVGETVLVFVSQYVSRGADLVLPDAWAILVQDKHGAIRLSPLFERAEDIRARETLRKVRSDAERIRRERSR